MLFCQNVHRALVGHYLQCNIEQINAIKNDFTFAELSPELKALLTIAASVQKGGKHVTAGQIEAAKEAGATDLEIHDTGLIAAAFLHVRGHIIQRQEVKSY